MFPWIPRPSTLPRRGVCTEWSPPRHHLARIGRRSVVLPALALAGLYGLASAPATRADVALSEDFDTTPVGALPDGWAAVAGTCGVRSDLTNDDGRVSNALVLTQAPAAVTIPALSATSFRLQLEAALSSHSSGFVHLRGVDLTAGYRVTVSPGLVRISRYTDSTEAVLATAVLPLYVHEPPGSSRSGAWYSLGVQVDGSELRVWEGKGDADLVVVDTQYPGTSDDTLILGLESAYTNQTASFDNVTLGAPEPYEPATALALPWSMDFELASRPERNGVDLPASIEPLVRGASYIPVPNRGGGSSDALWLYNALGPGLAATTAMDLVGAPGDAFRLEMDVVPSNNTAAFVHFRGPDLDNGYRVDVTSSGLLSVARFVAGAGTVLATATLPPHLVYDPRWINADTWYHIILQVRGSEIRVWEDAGDADLLVVDDVIAPAETDRMFLGIAPFYTHMFAVFDNLQISSANRAPVAIAGGPYPVAEGGAVIVSGFGTDADGDALTFAWDLDEDGTFETPGAVVGFSAADLDGPTIRSVSIQVTDSGGLTATADATVNVLNVGPTVGPITVPLHPVPVAADVGSSAPFRDPGTADTHGAIWDWGDGTVSAGSVEESDGSGSVVGTHAYSTPGVYAIGLSVSDDDGERGTARYEYVVVYNAAGSFVTGGGWIDSPPGAYPGNPTLAGKVTFGFVAKYHRDAGVPTGNTEFQFKAGDLHFRSTSYEWLVVAGARAQFKGAGTINGAGGYEFVLTATDGDLLGGGAADRFRIKITGAGGNVYDNNTGAGDDSTDTPVISGGSIVIHKS